LTKKHTQKLVPTGKGFNLIISFILFYKLVEIIEAQKVGCLGKNIFACIHLANVPNCQIKNQKIAEIVEAYI